MKQKHLIVALTILCLLVFRIYLGIQINFSHNDYNQIYLLGLENAYSGHWSYWGPDIVWSKTQIPGALQGLLAGIPLRICKHPYSPLILSNIISCIGLLLIGFYAKKRFPALSICFLIPLMLLLPFYLYHGVVLLNTAYLIFTGALLFIAVADLFIYRDDLILKSTPVYFMILGFAMIFTYQLHLSWIMFLPFIAVLLFIEWKEAKVKWWKPIVFFSVGCIISGITLLPTLIEYSKVIFTHFDSNLTYHPERLAQFFDLLARFFTYATFDITHNYKIFRLASNENLIIFILIRLLKIFAIIQFLVFWVVFYFLRKNIFFKKTFLLFILSLVMATCLSVIANKHIEARTFILLYPIPVWLSFFVYDYLFRYKSAKIIMNTMLVVVFITFLGIGITNQNDMYSFKALEPELKKALKDNKPNEFGVRRETFMNNPTLEFDADK